MLQIATSFNMVDNMSPYPYATMYKEVELYKKEVRAAKKLIKNFLLKIQPGSTRPSMKMCQDIVRALLIVFIIQTIVYGWLIIHYTLETHSTAILPNMHWVKGLSKDVKRLFEELKKIIYAPTTADCGIPALDRLVRYEACDIMMRATDNKAFMVKATIRQVFPLVMENFPTNYTVLMLAPLVEKTITVTQRITPRPASEKNGLGSNLTVRYNVDTCPHQTLSCTRDKDESLGSSDLTNWTLRALNQMAITMLSQMAMSGDAKPLALDKDNAAANMNSALIRSSILPKNLEVLTKLKGYVSPQPDLVKSLMALLKTHPTHEINIRQIIASTQANSPGILPATCDICEGPLMLTRKKVLVNFREHVRFCKMRWSEDRSKGHGRQGPAEGNPIQSGQGRTPSDQMPIGGHQEVFRQDRYGPHRMVDTQRRGRGNFKHKQPRSGERFHPLQGNNRVPLSREAVAAPMRGQARNSGHRRPLLPTPYDRHAQNTGEEMEYNCDYSRYEDNPNLTGNRGFLDTTGNNR